MSQDSKAPTFALQPTVRLRFVRREVTDDAGKVLKKIRVLQQYWSSPQANRRGEWRDIPLVEEGDKGVS